MYYIKEVAKYMNALENLSEYPHCDETVFEIVEEFVCRIYGYHNITNINEIRSMIFLKTHTSTDDEVFRRQIRNSDASALPPCQ